MLHFRRQDGIFVSRGGQESLLQHAPSVVICGPQETGDRVDGELDRSMAACLSTAESERSRWRSSPSELAAEIVIVKGTQKEGGCRLANSKNTPLIQAIWRDRWPVTLYFHQWSKPFDHELLVQLKSRLEGLAKKR
jgi:hypothetical protein